MTNATLVVLLLAPLPGQMGDEFTQDFRSGALHPAVGQFGPQATQVSRLGAKGLEITLPASRTDKGAVGVTPKFRISGDFEITVAYELLAADKPPKGLGSGVKLWGEIESADKQAMTLAHLVAPDGKSQLLTLMARIGDDDKRVLEEGTRPATARGGQLQLRRTGSELSFLVAEGHSGGFEELHRARVGTGDVTVLRISANTHDAASAVSVRLVEFRIRAARLPVTGGTPKRSGYGWVFWLVTLLAVGAGGFLAWRFRPGQGTGTAHPAGPGR